MINKIGTFIKKNINIIIVFILSFFIYNFLGFYINNGDPIASYGFSHAIRMGEVPYLDFNTVSTPLYAFYNSLFLLIFDDFSMFLLAQVILVTTMFIFLFKMFGSRSYIVFLAMVIFKFMGFSATYNLCYLVMSIIVLYLEDKYPKKDFLIGIFLGLCFLSKQTVGGLLVLPSLVICFKDYKKLLKRIGGFLIPCSIFLIYLISTKSLYQFIDLCFLGLFDFGGNNNLLFTIWFFLSFGLLGINIYYLVKKRSIFDYYGISYLGFILPIFDLNHFAYYLVGISIVIVSHLKELSVYKKCLVWGVIIQFIIFNTMMGVREYKPIIYKDTNHFKYRYNYKVDYKDGEELSKIINKYSEYDPVLIMYYSMTYNIINDRDISYFDVFLYGNHGYDGTEKMIKKIKKMNNKYFLINMDEYEKATNGYSQFNEKIVDYIISVSDLVDSYGRINVYYKR